MPDNYFDLKKLSDYPFGSGMSYSEVEYKNLKIENACTVKEIYSGERIEISIDVENCSDITINDVSMLFIKAEEKSISRRVRELKGFQRVQLEPYQKKKIYFYLTKAELEIYGIDNKYIIEPTKLQILVGGNINKLLSTTIDISY